MNFLLQRLSVGESNYSANCTYTLYGMQRMAYNTTAYFSWNTYNDEVSLVSGRPACRAIDLRDCRTVACVALSRACMP